MCGRFNVTTHPLSQFLMQMIGMAHPGPDNFNAAPTETITVLRLGESAEPELVPMRWWLTPYWAKEITAKYSMFNAKSETAHKSPAFREPFKSRRCVVPVSGFYEWVRVAHAENNAAKGTAGGQKLPYYIVPQAHEDQENDASGLLLAGLWDRWRNKETGEVLTSFTILTAGAASEMKFIHSRQPVMLSMSEARQWLDTGVPTTELVGLFASRLPVDLVAIPVSTHVNNARHKEPRCAEPIGDAIAIPSNIRSDSSSDTANDTHNTKLPGDKPGDPQERLH